MVGKQSYWLVHLGEKWHGPPTNPFFLSFFLSFWEQPRLCQRTKWSSRKRLGPWPSRGPYIKFVDQWCLYTNARVGGLESEGGKIGQIDSEWGHTTRWDMVSRTLQLKSRQRCERQAWGKTLFFSSSLRVEFLLKTDIGYPKDTRVTLFTPTTESPSLFLSFFQGFAANT